MRQIHFRKHTLWLLALLLGGMLLTACGQMGIAVEVVPSRTVQPSQTPGTTVVATSTPLPTITPTQPYYLSVQPETLKGIQLRFWHPWQGDLAWRTAERVVEFNNTNPWGITVQFYAPGGTLQLIDAVNLSLQDGTVPNVIIAPTDMLAAWQGEAKNLINLDEYIQLPELGLTEAQRQDFVPAVWQQDVLGNRRYGYPLQRDAQVLVYNQTWALEMGFPAAPTTPAQFQTQICAANQALLTDDNSDNDGTGGWIIRNDETVLLSWLGAFEYPALGDLQSDQYQFDTPEAQRALRYLRYLYDSNCSWISRNPSPYDYFATRQALAFSAELSQIPDLAQAMQFNQSADRWTLLPYPGQEKEPVLLLDGQSFAMFAASPEEQLASWLFMKWMNSPAYQAEIIQHTFTFPITHSVLEEIQPFRQANPAWESLLTWQDQAQAMPSGMYWTRVRSVLADASWQIYQQPELEEPAAAMQIILQQMDQIIDELIGRTSW